MDTKWISPNDNQRFGVGFVVHRVIFIAVFASVILGLGLFGNKLLALQKSDIENAADKMDYFPTRYHSDDCSICHLKKDGKILPQLKNPIPQLCLNCHLKIEQQMTDLFRHPIFTQGRCLDCHRIHTPLHKHLLKEDLALLCGNCHARLTHLAANDAHRALGGAASCLKCHSNHSSNNISLLSEDPIILCSGCHDLGESTRNHPVGKRYVDPRTGGMLTCTSSCHDPHGSEYKPMLQKENKDGLCLTCHNIDIF